MRAQSFADRRADRVVWPDRKWEWVGLRYEDGDFNAASYVDLDAREVWFYQAIGASPVDVPPEGGTRARYTGSGCATATARISTAGNHTTLRCRSRCRRKLFWSVTVYDAETRSQVQTDQGRAALRSLFELKGQSGDRRSISTSGPRAPDGQRRPVDQDHPRERLVRVLPRLRARKGRLRRQLEAGRLRELPSRRSGLSPLRHPSRGVAASAIPVTGAADANSR